VEFEWDENKNLRNLAKHKIGFEEAIEVFDDLNELTEPANTVGHEERLKTIGKVASLAVLLVVHTSRTTVGGQATTRVISARPASRRERKRYERREP
jgi:uncharacterized protein